MSEVTHTVEDNIPTKEAFENGKWIWEDSYPKDIDWNIEVKAKPLTTVLETAAEKYPDHHLCDFMGKTFT